MSEHMTEDPVVDLKGRDTVEFVHIDRIPVVKELRDVFEFRPDRPAYWLQWLCLWTLRKLGCYAQLETTKIERHVVGKKGEKFMHYLLSQQRSLTEFLNREPERLLIGAEDFANIMNEPNVGTYHWAFDAQYYKGNGSGKPTICGLRVEVVPWMRGLLVMP